MISGICQPSEIRRIMKPSDWFDPGIGGTKFVAFGKELKYYFSFYGQYPNFDQQFEEIWTEEEKQEIYSNPHKYIK